MTDSSPIHPAVVFTNSQKGLVMISRLTTYAPVSFVALTALAMRAGGEVIEFGDGQKEKWQAAVDDFTTIPFTEFPDLTIITEQYSHLGIHFVNGPQIIEPDWEAFPEDGAGIAHFFETPIILAFDQPMTHIAIDFPGEAIIDLYWDGELIYTPEEEFGGPDVGYFAGLISTEPFDEVWIRPDNLGAVFLDNLYFGPPIPAPGAFALFAVALNGPTRRRRT
jgi:hypothetical protein